MIKGLVWLILVVSITNCLDTLTRQTFSTSGVISNSDDINIAVSESIVGLYYPHEGIIMLHSKSLFLQNIVSAGNWRPTNSSMQDSTSKYVFETYLLSDSSLKFYYWYMEGSYFQSGTCTVQAEQNYSILKFSYTGEKYVSFTSFLSGSYRVTVQNFLTSESVSTTIPSVCSLKVTEASQTSVDLHYVFQTMSASFLKATVEMFFDGTVQAKISQDVASNCADSIEVYAGIVVLVCRSGMIPMISVYRESDMMLIYVLNKDSTVIATKVKILSSPGFKQILYNSYKYSSTYGTLSMIEIFPEKKNQNTIYIQKDVISKDSMYDGFGKYFDIDDDRTAFVSAKSDYVSSNVNTIETVKVCSHIEKYLLQGSTCTTILDSVTFGLQDQIETKCSDVDDSSEYNRKVSQVVCEYSCADDRFGKNCESCEVYLKRIGQALEPYQKYFYNSTSKICSVTEDQQYCSKVSFCLDCYHKVGCIFDKSANTCINGSSVINREFISNFISECPAGSIHDPKYCSESNFNLDAKNFTSLKPSVQTPAGTICFYNITSTQKITKNLKFKMDSSVSLTIIQSVKGVMMEVIPSTTRMLCRDCRELSEVTKTYSIISADYVTMSYVTSDDSSTFESSLEQGVNSQSPSDSNMAIIIASVVSIVIGSFLFGIIVFLICNRNKLRACFKGEVKESNQRDEKYKLENLPSNYDIADGILLVVPTDPVEKENLNNGDGKLPVFGKKDKVRRISSNLLINQDIEDVDEEAFEDPLPTFPIKEESFEIEDQKVDIEEEKEETEKEESIEEVKESCAICLQLLKDTAEAELISIPACRHQFHDQCFKDMAKFNSKQGFVKCPLCRDNVGVLFIKE